MTARPPVLLPLCATVCLLSTIFCGCAAGDVQDTATEYASNSYPESAPSSVNSNDPTTSEGNKDATLDDVPASQVIYADQLHSMINAGDDLFVVDVRSRGEYNAGYIDGALNIPAGRQIDIRMDEIPRDRTVVIISRADNRLGEVWATLVACGYDSTLIYVVSDGMRGWDRAGYPTIFIENPPC